MGKNIKLPLKTGFAALISHIKAAQKTAEQSGSAVSALAETTAAAIGEIEGILSEKQDIGSAVPFTIPRSGWASEEINEEAEEDEASYPFVYEFPVEGLTAHDRVDITIAPNSAATAAACGFCATVETLAGKFRVRAVSQPTEAIEAEYWLFAGKE